MRYSALHEVARRAKTPTFTIAAHVVPFPRMRSRPRSSRWGSQNAELQRQLRLAADLLLDFYEYSLKQTAPKLPDVQIDTGPPGVSMKAERSKQQKT